MRNIKTVLLVCLCLLASEVFAQQSPQAKGRPSYIYVGGGLAFENLKFKEAPSCSQDGLYLEGSITLDGRLFFQGRHVDVTSGSAWCGSTTTRLSMGLQNEYGSATSVYLMGTILNRDFGLDSDAGVSISGGVRSKLSSNMELEGALSFDSVDGVDVLYGTAAFSYWVRSDISVKAEVTTTDNNDAGLSFGARYFF